MSNSLLTSSPTPRRAGQERREEIIQALLDLLNAHGPEGVTTTAIARRMGLSQGALFRHFASKRDIWAAALDAIEARIKPGMAKLAQSHAPPLERIFHAMEFWLEISREIPAMTALLFYREPSDEGRQLRSFVAERSDRLRVLIRRLLGQARDRSELQPDVDLDAAAALCLGIVQTTLLRRHLLAPREPAESPRLMYDLVLRAIRR